MSGGSDRPPATTGAGATAVGGRARNEDAFLAETPVFLVADGMGGHLAGAEAAGAAIDAFRALATGDPTTPPAVVEAHGRARARVADVQRSAGGDSGTTLTGAIAVVHRGQPWWMVINVGDSRTYVLDGGVLRQVSVDHSHVQELVDAGRITPAQALIHPDRNLLTRAVGDDIHAMDVWLVPHAPGRRVVVASDGLMKEIDDAVIAEVASLAGAPAEAAAMLVEVAVRAGAHDNVTVVVADSTLVTPADADPAPWTVWGADAGGDTTPSVRRRGEP